MEAEKQRLAGLARQPEEAKKEAETTKEQEGVKQLAEEKVDQKEDEKNRSRFSKPLRKKRLEVIAKPVDGYKAIRLEKVEAEKQRLAELARQAEEAQKMAEASKEQEEAERLAKEEARQAEEAQKMAEASKEQEEAERLAKEEARQAEETQREAETTKEQEGVKRLAEEKVDQKEDEKTDSETEPVDEKLIEEIEGKQASLTKIEGKKADTALNLTVISEKGKKLVFQNVKFGYFKTISTGKVLRGGREEFKDTVNNVVGEKFKFIAQDKIPLILGDAFGRSMGCSGDRQQRCGCIRKSLGASFAGVCR